jgi:hypothetical protein
MEGTVWRAVHGYEEQFPFSGGSMAPGFVVRCKDLCQPRVLPSFCLHREDPGATAMLIDEAIWDYSREHDGEFPERLQRLIGEYLAGNGITAGDIADFSYTKGLDNSYELRLKRPGGKLTPGLIFTQEGWPLCRDI